MTDPQKTSPGHDRAPPLSPMQRFWLRRSTLVGILGGLVTAGLWLDSPVPDSKEPSEKPARANSIAVTVAPVHEQPLARTLALDAELRSLSAPVIAAQASAVVRAVLVRPGDSVQAGQVLAELDTTDLALALTEAQAQEGQVRSEFSQLTRDAARNEQLAAKEYVSRATLEAVQAQRAAAQKRLDAARARTAQAERALALAQVRAPHDATVLERHAAPGAYVRAGEPLFTLQGDASDATLVLHVPQAYAGQVQVGQTVRLLLAENPLETHIERIAPAIDPASRSFQAHLAVPPALAGYAGMSAGALLELSRTPALVVPAAAVQLNGLQQLAYVVQDGRAAARTVTLGRQQDGLVEVLSGLSAEEQVIVQGASFVRDGSLVDVAAAPGSDANKPGALR